MTGADDARHQRERDRRRGEDPRRHRHDHAQEAGLSHARDRQPQPAPAIAGHGLGDTPEREQHDEHECDVRRVRQPRRRRRPLRQQPGGERPEPEARGHRDRGAACGGVATRVADRWHRRLVHPGRACGEDRTAAHTGEQPPQEDQGQAVGTDHQDRARRHSERGRGDHHGAPPAGIGERAGEQKSGDQPERIDAEQRLERPGAESEVVAVDEQHRRELVRAPARAEEHRDRRQPCGACPPDAHSTRAAHPAGGMDVGDTEGSARRPGTGRDCRAGQGRVCARERHRGPHRAIVADRDQGNVR